MAHFVWSLGKLVNDPTTEIINEIRQRVFRKSCEPARDVVNETTATTSKGHAADQHKSVTTSKTSCTKEKPELPQTRSRCIQVGGETNKRRQISIQCQRSHHKRTCKSTSTQHVNFLNRSTGGSRVVVKKDAETMTMKPRVCEQHRKTLSTLQHWSAQQQKIKNPNISTMDQLKSTILRIANSLKLEKIQNIPPYHPPEKQCIRLYKCESVDMIKKRVSRKKRPTKTPKAATVEKIKAV